MMRNHWFVRLLAVVLLSAVVGLYYVEKRLLFPTSRTIAVLRNGQGPSMQIDTNGSESAPVTIAVKSTLEKITLKPGVAAALNSSLVYVANYVLEDPNYCTAVTNLSVLVIVHTAPHHFDVRNAIRSTWANNSFYSNLGTVKILFLLGLTSDMKAQKKLESEFTQNGDLLQGDFQDSYCNLTLKGVMAYKWITEKCRNADVVVKVDDDAIVNMIDVLTNIDSYKMRRHISCKQKDKGPVPRNKKHKWFVEEQYFRGVRTFPHYCYGFTVIFSNDQIPYLYQSALVTPFFWIDDIYLYGLVLNNVPNITYTDLNFIKHPSSSHPCTSGGPCPFTAVLLLRRNIKVMGQVWKSMLNVSQVNKVVL